MRQERVGAPKGAPDQFPRLPSSLPTPLRNSERHELPEIQRLWNMNQADSLIPGQRIPIVLIARKCMEENIKPFWQFAELTMPYSPQPDRRVYSLFAPRVIPRIYVSDAQGIIRHMYVDIGMPTAETLTAEITEMNKNK